MDGRLDNTEELRSALHRQGLFFSGASDPELVMAAWKVWGSDCLRHLEGDFALLVHNLVQGYTFCARDRVGNKPLHYCWTGSSLLVASTASGILAHPLMDSAENCPPDEATLAEFLAASFVSSTDTFWTPVKRLPPATAMIVDARGPRLFNWWKPDNSKAIRYKNPQDYVLHYRELLSRTVRQMSRSAYPLAVEASGGLDSSALLATSLELRKQDKLCAPAINAYAMVFPEEPEADESVWIRILSDYLNYPVTTLEPARKSLDWYFEEGRQSRDFPGYPNGVMNLAVRERAYKDGCRVLLSGWGGDEWLGGSRTYYADMLTAGEWRQLLQCLKTDNRECGLARSLGWLVTHGLLPLLPFPVRTRPRALVTDHHKYGKDTKAWLCEELRSLLNTRIQANEDCAPQKVTRPGQRAQLNTLRDWHYLHCYEYMERQAANAGIEMRRPYCSRQMIEFSLAIPEYIRLHGNTDRYLHRQAFKSSLPGEILDRSDKASFMDTFHYHLGGMETLLKTEIPARHPHWVNPTAIAAMFDKVTDHEYRGWSCWMLGLLFECAAVHTHD